MSKYRNLDLNELKMELRNAYVKKSLKVQIREREIETEMEKIREDYRAKLDKLRTMKLDEQEKILKIDVEHKRETYRRDLESQMTMKELTKKLNDDELRKERLMLVEADRLVDEKFANEKTRMRKELAERLQRERKIFLEIKTIRKRMEMEAEMEEKMRNDKYNEDVERRTRELDELRDKQKKRRLDLIESVANALVNLQSKKLSRDSKTSELVAEEIAWELVIQERENELRMKKMREKLSMGLKKQIHEKEELARRACERDREFAEMIMRRIMDDEKVEKLTNEARMRSRIAYREDLIRLMDERREIRRLEEERIAVEFQIQKHMEQLRRNDVSEARRQLLVEHARNVASYVGIEFLTDEEKIIVAEALKK